MAMAIVRLRVPLRAMAAAVKIAAMKLLAWLLLLLAAAAAGAADDAVERARFKRAYDAQLAGRSDALQLAQGLEQHPLYIYLRYQALRPRLTSMPVAEIERFFADYPQAYLSARLRTEWLKVLARAGQWPTFERFYRPQADAELQCLALQTRVRRGQTAELLDATGDLWLVGKSQSAACDPVFDYLKTVGLLSDALVWERVWLAARAGKPALARFIARKYAAPSDRVFADLLPQIHAHPEQTLRHALLRHDGARVRAIIGYGVVRLAVLKLDRAMAMWHDVQDKYRYTLEERGAVDRELALVAAAQNHAARLALLDRVPPAFIDEPIERYRIREGLEERAWTALARWTERAPTPPTNALRWRYWRARALAELGRADEANAIFAALAAERDYYGFLASDILGRPYAMTHRPVAPAKAEFAALTALPGIRRTHAFYLLGMRSQARQEWQFETARMSKRDLEIAAKVAYDWGWYDRAIFALGQSQSYDDLDLRFPVLHKEVVLNFAQRRKLPPAIVYSIIRGESAFVTDARSPAGALGLMQLMPATGAETARRIGLKLAHPSDLTAVDTNIAIGSEYLRIVLNQFGGSFPLAAAAYNAGPGRVRSWLPKSGCVPADIWIDTIPFAETESYVRRALFYAAVYEWRLGERINALSSRLAEVSRRGTGATGRC